jgi:hypothetical protein
VKETSIMKKLLLRLLVWLCCVVLVPILGEAQTIGVHAVGGSDSEYVIQGYIEYSPVEWSDAHQVNSFHGEVYMNTAMCEEQLAKWFKEQLDNPPPIKIVGPATLQQLTAGFLSGNVVIGGECGQFFAAFEMSPDSFTTSFNCQVPDSVCGPFVACHAVTSMQQVGPGTARENGTLIEWFSPDVICTSQVAMDLYYDSSVHFESVQHVTLYDTLVRMSDTEFAVSGVVRVDLSHPIPTLSEWGMIIFVVLLAGWMTFVVVRRWKASQAMA